MHNPFRYVNSSPEVMRLVVMMYIRYPLSLRQVDDMLVERGIDICHDTVRLWWNRFGPLFAAQIRKQRVPHRSYAQWRWFVRFVLSGSTMELKIHTTRSAEEKARWPGSGTSRPCRNLPPSTPRSATPSTTNALSTAALFPNKTAPLLWPSSVTLQLECPQL